MEYLVHLNNVLNIANRGRNAFCGTTTKPQMNAALPSLKVRITISKSFTRKRMQCIFSNCYFFIAIVCLSIHLQCHNVGDLWFMIFLALIQDRWLKLLTNISIIMEHNLLWKPFNGSWTTFKKFFFVYFHIFPHIFCVFGLILIFFLIFTYFSISLVFL